MTTNDGPPPIPARYGRPEWTEFWGQRCRRQTALANSHLGDGKVLLWVVTINSRPSGYLIRVDGSWLAEGHDGHDHIDDVLDALADDFGTVGRERENLEEDGLTEDEIDDRPELDFPTLDCDCGYSWCVYRWWDGRRWRAWPNDWDRDEMAKIRRRLGLIGVRPTGAGEGRQTNEGE